MTKPVNQNAHALSTPASRGFMSKNMLWFVVIALALGIALILPSLQKRRSNPKPPNDALWLDASAKASQTGLPILIDFTADWCPPCQTMKKEVFPVPAVKALMQDKFVFVEADLTTSNSEGSPLGTQYEITAIPTFMILDPQGNIISQKVGGMSASAFTHWLSESSASYKPVQAASSVQTDKPS